MNSFAICQSSLSIAAALLALVNASLVAAEWKAGLASTVITPKEPVHLAGYASRNKPSEGVENDLYLKVLALEDKNGHRGVIVTSDVIGFRAAFADPVCERITAKTGLQRSQILLNSSHTHTGPALTVSDRASYNVKGADTANARYAEWLQGEIVSAVERALAKMELADLAWGAGVVNFPMNRREFTPAGVILGVNPRGPVDRSVPVLRVTGADGRPRAVLFGAACHNTTLGGRDYKISGDFAGFSQEFVEKELKGVQAMFMQGCAGDSNPHPKGTYDIAREHGATLGREALRVLETKLQPVKGTLRTVFGYADVPLAPALSRREIEAQINAKPPGGRAWALGQMLEALDKGEKLPTHYRAPIGVWQFGDDLTLVALSGEVVVDYVFLIEKALGPLKLWISAYNNDVFGYLPSARVLEEGGYETRGIIHGGIGFFSPQSQDVVVAKVKELAGSAGRK